MSLVEAPMHPAWVRLVEADDPSPALAQEVAAVLSDCHERDLLVVAHLDRLGPLGALLGVVRGLLAQGAPGFWNVVATHAFSEWLDGDVVTAHEDAARALGAVPGHSLAQLVCLACEAGMAPETLRPGLLAAGDEAARACARLHWPRRGGGRRRPRAVRTISTNNPDGYTRTNTGEVPCWERTT